MLFTSKERGETCLLQRLFLQTPQDQGQNDTSYHAARCVLPRAGLREMHPHPTSVPSQPSPPPGPMLGRLRSGTSLGKVAGGLWHLPTPRGWLKPSMRGEGRLRGQLYVVHACGHILRRYGHPLEAAGLGSLAFHARRDTQQDPVEGPQGRRPAVEPATEHLQTDRPLPRHLHLEVTPAECTLSHFSTLDSLRPHGL